MKINSPTIQQVFNCLDESVESFTLTYRKSSIKSEMSGEFLNQSVDQALKRGNSDLTKPLFQVSQYGYIYVYSCNTSAMTVRTDNLFIAHYQGSLLEEFHYYPFGMCFEVSKSPMLGKSAAVKYNSQLQDHEEFEDANGNVYGLEDYNFAFRNYDAQIGRWLQPDPLMQHPSPYLAMSNNPVSFTDPLGLWDDPIINSRGELVHDDGLNNGKYYMLDFAISTEDYKNNKIYRTYNVHEISRGEYYSKKISFAFVMMSASGGYKQMGEAYGEQTARYNVNHFNWAQGLVALSGGGGNNIIYQRMTETNQSTTGNFSIPGTNIGGYILEPAGPSTTQSGLDRRIPAGTYNLIPNVGTKYGLRLYNAQVPQSRAILMHIGNYPGDTEGCLLPGSSIGTNFVGGSGPMINQIMNHFNQVGFNGATITILDINRP